MLKKITFIFLSYTVWISIALSNTPAQEKALRQQFDTAYQLTKINNSAWKAKAKGLEDYVLYPYLEWASLTQHLSIDRATKVQNFLEKYADSFLSSELRKRWLKILARQKNWDAFLRNWKEQKQQDIALQCYYIQARIATQDMENLVNDALALWLTGDNLPTECDSAIHWLKTQKAFTDEIVWQRIQLAAAKKNTTLIGYLTKQLPLQQQSFARHWITVLTNPEKMLTQAANWPIHYLNQSLVTLVLEQLAKKNHQHAGQLWLTLESRLHWETALKNRILAAIVIQKAASYDPDATWWLDKTTNIIDNPVLNEWRARYHLAMHRDAAALQALQNMPPEQQEKARWRYLQARLHTRNGQSQLANELYHAIADQANFYGFLAAEHLQKPYTICEKQPVNDTNLQTRIHTHPGLLRALELHRLGWKTFAQREWDFTINHLTQEERYLAVAFAQQHDWTDRGPFTLLKPEDQTYYALRFPIHHRQTIEKSATQHAVDPAFVFSLIRAESAWVTDARSVANARGLMQLLPSVAAPLAQREKINYQNADDLFNPVTNIQLGIAHLQSELYKSQNKVWVALAAHNAGPTPVKRWQAQRGNLPADLWIETIPYYETREYVPRILAFNVIYDFLLNKDAGSLMQKLHLQDSVSHTARHNVQCAAPNMVTLHE